MFCVLVYIINYVCLRGEAKFLNKGDSLVISLRTVVVETMYNQIFSLI